MEPNMEEYVKVIYDGITQTETIIQMTEEEITELKRIRAQVAEEIEFNKNQEIEKEKDRESAIQKLKDAGLTMEEIQAIL
jgi:uncharacterized protein YbcI